MNNPVHCIKLLSTSDVSVQMRVFYDNVFTEEGPEVFDDGDIVDENRTTMCKTLKEEYHNKKVAKVDIQKKDLNDAIWRSNGILVQTIPGGKIHDCHICHSAAFN